MICLDISGNKVEPNNPNRLIWYSGGCSYWTDDWSKLRKTATGIPYCACCQCPGMQILASKWEEGAEEYEKTNPDYRSFLQEVKEKCIKNKSVLELYREWKQDGKRAINNTLKSLDSAELGKRFLEIGE